MKQFCIRLLIMTVGLALFAFGIVMTIKANIGYAPWDVFHAGIAGKTGLSLGTISILVGVAVGIIVTVLGEKVGLGTILNMVLVGIFIDVFFLLLPLAENLIIGLTMLFAGLLAISVGTYLYIRTAFGAGPRDSLMVVMARKTKLSAGVCRGVMELVVTIIGWFLGGMVGAGTVIIVISIGFFIQMTFKLFRFDVTAVKHETIIETYATLKRIKTGFIQT